MTDRFAEMVERQVEWVDEVPMVLRGSAVRLLRAYHRKVVRIVKKLEDRTLYPKEQDRGYHVALREVAQDLAALARRTK